MKLNLKNNLYLGLLVFIMLALFTFSKSKHLKSNLTIMKVNNDLSRNSSNLIIDYDFLKTTEKLREQMIKKQEAIFKKFKFNFLSKYNRFVVADEDIKKDQELVKIPFLNTINIKNPSVEKFCNSIGNPEFKGDLLFKNQFYCLIIFIMHQKKNTSQEYKYYIESFPKDFTEYYHFWKESDLNKVKNTLIEVKMIERRKSLKRHYDEYTKSIFFTNLKDKSGYSFDDFVKAYILVGSRNFGVTVNKILSYHVMVPFVDLFNFSPILNTRWTAEIESNKDFFKIKAKVDIKKSEEIFVNYGRDDNALLLCNYGFTLEKNPFNIQTNYFEYELNGKKNTWIVLEDKDPKRLVVEVKRQRAGKNKKNLGKNEKEAVIKNDILVFEAILKSLKTYVNKKRIDEIKNNLKETPNTINIHRVLVDENILLEKNIGYVNEFINILKGGKEKLKKFGNSVVYKEAKDYFDELL